MRNFAMDNKKLGKLLSTIDLYPIELDLAKDDLRFLEVSRGLLEQEPFHDYRLLGDDSVCYNASVDSLLQLYRKKLKVSPANNYIFHTAFCGSTLLSKYLGYLQGSFVYREPPVFADLADVKALGSLKQKKKWKELFSLAVRLSARTPEGLAPIVKLNDNCTNLAPELLKSNSGAKGVMLYASLENHLLAVLKSPDHREFAHKRIELFGTTLPEPMRSISIPSLSDAQAGACLWLLHMHYVMPTLASHKSRFFSLDSDSFFSRQEESLIAIADVFNISCSDSDAAEVVSAIGQTHSKTGKAYTEESRQKLIVEQRKLSGDEVAFALNWVQPYLEAMQIPSKLPQSLL